jgi:hypothetical protein
MMSVMARRKLIAAVIAITAACSGSGDVETTSTPLRGNEVDVSAVRATKTSVGCSATLDTNERGTLAISAGTTRLILSERLVEPAIVDAVGRTIVWTDDGEQPGSTALRVAHCSSEGAWQSPRTLVDDGGTPNRIAVSADASHIAYVSSANGLAALWVVAVDTGETLQLTNRDLVRVPGAAPDGFVPVPDRSPPRFEGDRLVWSSRQGKHEVVLP